MAHRSLGAARAARAWLVLAMVPLLAACSGGPAATTAPTTAVTAAPPAATATAAPVGGTGPSLQSIFGSAPPAVPAGTTWTRIGADNGAFTFEVPSTWTTQQTVPWAEADGSSSGSLVVAGTNVNGLGTDFSAPGVAIGITTNPTGRTAADVVTTTDYSTTCTGEPAGTENGAGYTAAYRVWTACGGRADAFLLVVVVNPAGTQALFVVIFQGAAQADLGYVERIIGSVQAGAGTPGTTTAPPAATTPPANAQGWTVNMEECLLQIGDAIAIGTVTNMDTRDHAYRVIVRFTTPENLLIGEAYWDTPALAPGQPFRFQIRQLAQGYTAVNCTVSDVLIRN